MSARPDTSRPLIAHAMASLLAVVLLGACASAFDTQDAAFAERFKAMTETVLDEVALIHIDPAPPDVLVMAGFQGLQDISTSITVNREGDRAIIRRLDGRELAHADLPAGKDIPTAIWAEDATELVMALRTADPVFAVAEEETLYDAFVGGMISPLDRFSRYNGREDAREARAEREGFGGIGIGLAPHPDGARIEDITPGNPAAAAGLQVGDILVAIDGIAVGGEAVHAITERLRGPIDRPVLVTIRRERLTEPVTVTVGRTRIVPDTITQERLGAQELIQISSFNQRTAKRLAEALSRARARPEGAPKGIILDLRGNPGGLLDQAVDSADLFLDHGLISRADGRHPNSHQRFEAEPGDLAAGLPLVVLVNGASASASEILASALQDQGRAVVIGMTSFGKGTIQTVVQLPNEGELYLTWAHFVAPSGYPLQRLGVGPTICTAGENDAVRALDAAFATAGAGADSSESRARAVTLRRALGETDREKAIQEILALCPWLPHEGADIDVAVAKLLLGSPTLYARALALGRQDAQG
ncbi:PDZ domain-containing protein [Marivibrio halodurans]|uniref:PDZ domain-containing protein n=1 Tax=Marivibrio halodurans TaxID=2039722 RepID=A0A8J7V3M5_9PROT|nr:S41 family peptidase [Marivibrio halodurans]MBP5856909.1 PDZ domain-containing protein [Marivibrio halodurans]